MAFYKTLAHASESLYRVLGSKHIGYAIPVKSESEAKQKLEELRKLHAQATHVCYAWRVGWDKNLFRSSDDGEPSGTAGKPILGQIQSFDLTNICIAVVRYYGGTKLGTGGLIDAYKTAARLAIEANEVVEQAVRDHYRLSFSYAQLPEVMKALKEMNMEKIDFLQHEQCELEFLVEKKWEEKVRMLCEPLGESALIHLGRM
jgi:uncharacterized YigZ family protein